MNDPLTSQIIGIAYLVHRKLGSGFLEKVYENALAIEFARAGIQFVQQGRLDVFYDGEFIGYYVPDFIIDGRLIVEVKAIRMLSSTEEVQVVNYLTATGINVGLIINFGERSVEIKRKHRIYRKTR